MKHMNWIAAGAVAAMLAAASPALKAQDATSTTTTTTTTTSGSDIPTIAPVAPIDYSILRNQDFTYMDLKQAHASGLTDNRDRRRRQDRGGDRPALQPGPRRPDERGESFTTLATKYGLDLGDLYNVDDEKTEDRQLQAGLRDDRHLRHEGHDDERRHVR